MRQTPELHEAFGLGLPNLRDSTFLEYVLYRGEAKSP